MKSCRNCRNAWGASALLALALLAAAPGGFAAAQEDPELRAIVSRAIEAAQCFPDKYESAVWYTFMEPKLRKIVKDHDERMQILTIAFCEANRPGEQKLSPGLVMAIMDVESHFDRWAISPAGAVGLMQVMPFWPAKLGMQRHQLTHVEANIRMGCAILRHYLQVEKNNVRKALARYNGSVGKHVYPDMVVQRWTTRWGGIDDAILKSAQR